MLKIHNYYLYEIVTDEETVRFNVGTRIDLKGARKVNNIEVRDKKENLVKRFNFVYSYMNGSSVGGDRLYDYYEKRNMLSAYNSLYNSNEINQRLLLISLQEEVPDAAGALKKLSPYRFKYNAALPAKTSSARDYWGYFNGKDNTTLLVSRSKSGESGYNNFPYSTTTSLIYADRRCNPTTVSAGMLSGMVYPTGGETSFSYEPHSFTNYIYLDTRYTQLPASFSLSVVATNANTVIPEEYRKPKDFTIDRDTEVEVSISHYCPAGESWRDMLGSPAFIYIYEQIPSSGAPIISFHPYKGWAITRQRAEVLTLSSVSRYMVLRGQSTPAVIPDEQMERFRFMLDYSEEAIEVCSSPLAPGEQVRVIKGPLAGLEGELVTIDGKSKVAVRLDMLGCAHVDMPVGFVERVGKMEAVR